MSDLAIIETSPDDAFRAMLASIGDVAGAPAQVPAVISKRQFLLVLFRRGLMTEAEAISANVVPSAISIILDTIPDELAAEARIEWATMRDVERHHPIVEMVGMSMNWSTTELDDLWREGAAI